jgi:hypothetical protein
MQARRYGPCMTSMTSDGILGGAHDGLPLSPGLNGLPTMLRHLLLPGYSSSSSSAFELLPPVAMNRSSNT